MSRRLLIEFGVAQTRAAFVDGEAVTHLWIGPARGDEDLPRPPGAGDLYAGRVSAVSASMNAVFVDIGAERDGFMPLRKGEKAPPEGARGIFMVRRPPVGEKGAVLTDDWKGGLDRQAVDLLEAQAAKIGAGPIGDSVDAAIQAFVNCGPDGSRDDVIVLIEDPRAIGPLRENGARVEIVQNPFDEWDVDDVIAESLDQHIVIPGGVRLHFHETEAGALIDVDTAAATGAFANANNKANLAAAARILLEISRRQIGGRVIIDFLPPANGAARSELARTVAEGIRALGGARFGKVSPDGLCDLTLPRRRLSLLEQASEPAGRDWAVPGRRLTADWIAKSAFWALERRLLNTRSARLALLVAPPIADYVEARPWADRLAQRVGARFKVVASEKLGMSDFDVVE